MTKLIKFTGDASKEITIIARTNKKMFIKINALIEDIQINGPKYGIGHPEPLKGSLTDYYSRKIDSKNRLIYKVDEDIIIIKCLGHYFDK